MTQNDLRKKYPYYDQIQRFRLIDDTFMSVVFQDIGCTQFLIRILLQNDGLNVTEVGTQNSLKNLRAGRCAWILSHTISRARFII